MRELLHGTQKPREKGKQMSDEAMMNIICDKLAGATTQAALAGGSVQHARKSDIVSPVRRLEGNDEDKKYIYYVPLFRRTIQSPTGRADVRVLKTKIQLYG